MALPTAIGALPPVPSAAAGIPSPLAQFGSALGEYPDDMRKRQIDEMQQQVQRQQLGQQLLATISQRLSSDPNAANDPALAQQADRVTQQSGLPSVTQRSYNDQGQFGERINRDALIPRKFLRDLDSKTLNDLRGLDPQTRLTQAQAMGIDVNDPDAKGFLSAPPDVSLNPAIVDAANRSVDSTLKLWQAGQMTPEAYAASLQRFVKPLGAQAIEALTSDGVLSAGISQYAATKIAAIPAEIAAKVDLTKLRSRIEDDAMTRFRKNFGLKQDQLAEKKAVDASQASLRLAQARKYDADAAKASADATNAARSLDLKTQMFQAQLQKINTGNAVSVANLALKLQGEKTNAQRALDTLDNNIAQQLNANRADPNDPSMQVMFDQRKKLQASIDAMSAALSGAPQKNDSAGRAVSAVVNAPVSNVSAGSVAIQTGTSKSGKPIYSTDGGKSWLYGSP